MPYDPRKHGARCDTCPRRLQTPVPPEGNPSASVVWLGNEPGKQEVKKGRPFVGATGKRLGAIWERATASAGSGTATLPRADLWVTNAALCFPVTRSEKEAKQTMDCCRPRLQQELKRLHPDAWILVMGRWAFYAVTGKAKGIGRYLGFHVKVKP